MNISKKSVAVLFLIVSSTLTVFTTTSVAMAGKQSTVQKFYDFLSNPGSQAHADELTKVMADDWESIGDYSGRAKTKQKFLAQMGGFAKLIPDLNWEVKEMYRDGRNVIVRGRATGTPQGPLFGVDGKGKGFDILTIDIHTLERGKIVRSYHVEDWAGALRQLKSQ